MKPLADFVTFGCMIFATYAAFFRHDALLAMQSLVSAFWIEVIAGIVEARRKIRRRA